MDILVVGAGATGQVLGVYFQRGGAEVSFFVRPKYAEDVRRGMTVEERGGKRRIMPLAPQSVVTSAAEAGKRRWDAVLLCVSSTALRAGTWFEELAAAVGETTYVCIPPGQDDRAFVTARAPRARIVWAMFPLIAYDVGDVEDTQSTAIAVWRPPATRLPLAGDPAHARPLADVLARGGLPARVVDDVTRDLAFSGAVLNLHVIGLECAGWSFSALRQDASLLALVHAAMRETLAFAAHRVGAPVPFPLRLIRPWVSRLLLRLAPRLLPLPAETYFRVHFVKVGDQTAEQLESYVAGAERAGLPAPALRQLADRYRSARAERRAARKSA